MATVNYYHSISQPKVVTNIAIENWLNQIKTGNTIFLSLIEEARKLSKNNPRYKEIKEELLPAITWNFTFNRYKNDRNISQSTGFLYIDVDKSGFKLVCDSERTILIEKCNNQIVTFDTDKVFASYSSLSNFGKGIIVKVANVLPDNFKAIYEYVLKDLGLTAYFDKNATKKTQFNVLSYDPNIFINNNSFIYDAALLPKKTLKTADSKKETLVKTNVNTFETNTTDNYFFRNNNLDEYWIDGEVVVSKEGYAVASLWLPKTIANGKRNQTLMSYCNNLVYLNPCKTPHGIFKALKSNNIHRCVNPLPDNEIWSIVNCILKQRDEGTLTLKHIRTRKIIFHPNCGLIKKEKQNLVAKTVGGWRVEKTKSVIYEFIEQFEGENKLTCKFIAEQTGLSKRTVERYLPEFKEYVAAKFKTNRVQSALKLKTNLEEVYINVFPRRLFIYRENNLPPNTGNISEGIHIHVNGGVFKE
jgi:hypothetical protein